MSRCVESKQSCIFIFKHGAQRKAHSLYNCKSACFTETNTFKVTCCVVQHITRRPTRFFKMKKFVPCTEVRIYEYFLVSYLQSRPMLPRPPYASLFVIITTSQVLCICDMNSILGTGNSCIPTLRLYASIHTYTCILTLKHTPALHISNQYTVPWELKR